MNATPSRTGSFYDTYTATHHVRAVAWAGVASGIMLLSEVVAYKHLGATRWHVLLLLLLPATAQFVAASWNPTDPRRLLGKHPFRGLGIPSKLLLLAFLVVPALRTPTLFVAIVASVMAAEALLIPAQNLTLARNYTQRSRGRLFGRAVAVQSLALALVAVPAGWVLDHVPAAWPLMLGVAGLAGALGYLHWSRLRRRTRRRLASEGPGEPQHAPSPWQVLRSDRTFLAFEACIMVYGIGFMMLQPVLPVYLVDELHVTYTQVGLARGLLFFLAMVVAGPVLGHLSDRIGILRLGACAFLFLATFPLILLFVPGTTGLYAGYVAYGLAMAGVHVTWTLGPIALAGTRDPLPYLNAHVALVGIRAVIGMVGGSLLAQASGARTVFWCVALLELLAAAGTWMTAHVSGRRWTLSGTAPV